ncbi:hypothetical protein PSET11_01358 [Arthrobacter ulcerisalmonis]|uniref:Uncharacterized protein n=1 Tax=Arthrobacter ulcerisalmonis TaxID=2483813 RepID=A0A3P5WZK4_9MICC|nr:hypothetical protein PSET11_01358 [Arthrobacter ulcerisalmonis]
MQYKPSAGIFIGGLVLSFAGVTFMLLGNLVEEPAVAILLGMLGLLVGLVLLCVGASRALVIIDQLPAAFRHLERVQEVRPSQTDGRTEN